jgi:hypothetical protein
MSDGGYNTPQDFLLKMDAGELDGNVGNEAKRLTVEQLVEVAHILMARDDAEADG